MGTACHAFEIKRRDGRDSIVAFVADDGRIYVEFDCSAGDDHLTVGEAKKLGEALLALVADKAKRSELRRRAAKSERDFEARMVAAEDERAAGAVAP